MEQQALIHFDIYGALEADIGIMGGSGKVGPAIWPSMDERDAARKLLNCINPHHSQKLGLDELAFILKLARGKSGFATMYFLCDEALMSHPLPIEPEDEKARLQKEVIKAADTFKGLIVRLERL